MGEHTGAVVQLPVPVSDNRTRPVGPDVPTRDARVALWAPDGGKVGFSYGAATWATWAPACRR